VSRRRVTIVDGNNVIGSVPDGWWRDRRTAARRLLGRLQCLHPGGEGELILVLDRADPDRPEGDYSGVALRYARRRGANAADDRIRELVAELAEAEIAVVTSDRALADDVRPHARVITATSFLRHLEQAGC
jgi:predicted RNA-binding protein with PIN domain